MSNPNDRIILTRHSLQTLINEIKAEIVTPAVNNLFPVGFVYVTSKAPNDGGDPNVLFPGTTWVRLTGAFIWAASDSDTVTPAVTGSAKTADGGSATCTIETSNLPPHKHPLSGSTQSALAQLGADLGSPYNPNILTPADFTTSEGGYWKFRIRRVSSSATSQTPIAVSGADSISVTVAGPDGVSGNRLALESSTDANYCQVEHSGHRHTLKQRGHTHTLSGNTGDNTTTHTALNIKNPYINRYCWERTA